ncbi:MAG: efflux transporter, permease/ATP-binding protein, partial [Deltaproteobacteria bacterium]|nr:efflux transporter, permease/ATP-binding protein [Deltaproteobacteria bacterium]
KLARMNAFLQEHVTGVAVVKTFGMEGKSERRFDGLNGEYAAEGVRLTNLYSVYFPGVEMLASIAVALLLWRGGVGLLTGALTFGTLVAFLEYARRFYDPIRDMSDKYNILQTALASSERIFRLLDEEISPEYAERLNEPAPDARPSPSPLPSGSVAAVPAIEFRDVWFSYPRPAGAGAAGWEEGLPVLRGLSFILQEGQTGAIVGAASTRSAAGRSFSSGGTSARSRGRSCADRSPSSSRTRSSSRGR